MYYYSKRCWWFWLRAQNMLIWGKEVQHLLSGFSKQILFFIYFLTDWWKACWHLAQDHSISNSLDTWSTQVVCSYQEEERVHSRPSPALHCTVMLRGEQDDTTWHKTNLLVIYCQTNRGLLYDRVLRDRAKQLYCLHTDGWLRTCFMLNCQTCIVYKILFKNQMWICNIMDLHNFIEIICEYTPMYGLKTEKNILN